jgi:hypothetical protein
MPGISQHQLASFIACCQLIYLVAPVYTFAGKPVAHKTKLDGAAYKALTAMGERVAR